MFLHRNGFGGRVTIFSKGTSNNQIVQYYFKVLKVEPSGKEILYVTPFAQDSLISCSS